MGNIIKATNPNLKPCPICQCNAEYVHTMNNTKYMVCCTEKSCLLHAGTLTAWETKEEAALSWNDRKNKSPNDKKWSFSDFENLPKWLQKLWNIDSSLARQAEGYLKNNI